MPQSTDVSPAMPALLTKLHRPQVSPGIEWRARLLEPLNQNIDRALSLISAPAGYGKTTLASLWLQSSGRASAWVSLDERDDDLLIFTGCLADQAALNGVLNTLYDYHYPVLRVEYLGPADES